MNYFQYISDIHLEHYNVCQVDSVIPKKISPILILAGDIGYPKKDTYKYFIDKVSSIWDKIFLIAGNHEFYQTEKFNKYNEHKINTIEEINDIILSIVKNYSNVHFLSNSKYEIEIDKKKFIILGSPLFSYIPDDRRFTVFSNMNDFNYIYLRFILDGNLRKISTSDFNILHSKCLNWLEKELNFYKKTDFNIVVITHYAPTIKSIDEKYKDNKLNCAFYSDLDRLIDNNIYCWIHGHTHSQREVEVNGIKVVNNSIGYLFEKADNVILEKTV